MKFIGYEILKNGGAHNVVKYSLVFELSNFFGSKYIGVLVDSPIQGFGSAKYEKVIFNSSLDLVLEILGMNRGQIQEKNCGDQKIIYSSYNRGDASQLPYGYAGKNFNVVSEQVMDEVAKANTKAKGRVCENDHY